MKLGQLGAAVVFNSVNNAQLAAKKMADGGKVINISSSVTKATMPTYGA